MKFMKKQQMQFIKCVLEMMDYMLNLDKWQLRLKVKYKHFYNIKMHF